MADEIDFGMTLRDEVNADLSDELVARVRDLIGAQRTETLFRDRLVHILTRYEVYLAGTKTTTRNEVRKQISSLQKKAQGLLHVLEALQPEIRQSLEGRLNALTEDNRWEGFDFFDTNQPLPQDDNSLQLAKSACGNIVEACFLELELLEETRTSKRGSRNPALDQLLIDLAALYETETGHLARSQCYRDETSEDGYGGRFYCMAKAVLDEVVQGSYETPAALGIRILRLLTDA